MREKRYATTLKGKDTRKSIVWYVQSEKGYSIAKRGIYCIEKEKERERERNVVEKLTE